LGSLASDLSPGFAGKRFKRQCNREIALAPSVPTTTANLYDWCNAAPGRFMPADGGTLLGTAGPPWRGQASFPAQGVTALSFFATLAACGFPSIHDNLWILCGGVWQNKT